MELQGGAMLLEEGGKQCPMAGGGAKFPNGMDIVGFEGGGSPEDKIIHLLI